MRIPPRLLIAAEPASAAGILAAVQQSGPADARLVPTADALQVALAEGSATWDAVVLVQGGPVDEVEAALYVPEDLPLVVVDGGDAVLLTDGAVEAVPLDRLLTLLSGSASPEGNGQWEGPDVTDAEVLWEGAALPPPTEVAWREADTGPADALSSDVPPLSLVPPPSASASSTPMFDFQFDDISAPEYAAPSILPPVEAERRAPDLNMIVRAKPESPQPAFPTAGASGVGGEVGSSPAVAGEDGRPPILVVEDNGDTRMLLERVLRSTYEVTAVADARSALLAMNERRFAGLVLDINLGGKETGADVLRIARSLSGYEGVFAIALTAYALPGDRERLLASGFSEYISKPFTRQSLMDALAAGVQA